MDTSLRRADPPSADLSIADDMQDQRGSLGERRRGSQLQAISDVGREAAELLPMRVGGDMSCDAISVTSLYTANSDQHGGGADTRASRRSGSEDAAQSSASHQLRVRSQRPILICDDEARLVSLTAGLLREFGYDVLTVRTGREAVRAVNEHPIDVVILDVNLPGEDVRDVVASMRLLQASVSVILSSGYTEDDVEPELLQEPVVKAFLSKPYTIDVLVSAIDRVRVDVERQSQTVSRDGAISSR